MGLGLCTGKDIENSHKRAAWRGVLAGGCLLLAVLAAGLISACNNGSNGAESGESAPITAPVEEGDFTITVAATGKVIPAAEVLVKSKASGEIVEFPFRAGQRVVRGQLVCRLDPSDEERNVERQRSELRAAQARLESARAGLRLAEADQEQAVRDAKAGQQEAAARLDEALARLQREEELYVQGVVSEEEVQAARTRVAEARAGRVRGTSMVDRALARDDEIERARQEVLQAESRVRDVEVALDETRQRLAETRILAPLSGVVTETLVENGQVISSAISNVGGGTDLMRIADLSSLFVLLSVDEVDIGQVRLGLPALIEADAFPGREFAGHVVQVAPVGVEQQNVVQFEVRVTVDDSGADLLRPGMSADVEIEVARSADTLWVPRGVVRREDSTVQVLLGDAEVETRSVRTGLQDANRVEIVEGLEEGDQVLVGGREVPSDWRKPRPASSRSATTRFLWRLRKK